MHNPVKFAAAALAAAVLCSCGAQGVRVGIVEKEYETGSSTVEARLPQFECDANPSFAESLNGEYDALMMSLLDEFIIKTQDKDAEFEIKSDVKLNNGRLVSVVCDGEVFSGGAHGEKFRICRSIDFVGGKILTLDDIFSDEGWKTAVDTRMEQLALSGDEEYKDLWEKPSTKLLKAENFYITDDSIVFFFPPYELSYYRRGFVEFEFEYSELSGYLTPEFAAMVSG